MGEFGFGQSVRRKEDPRLLTGRGCFIDDRVLTEQCHAIVLHSPHAHAELRGIDTGAALASPGVIAILTGDDLAADRIGEIRGTFTLPVFPGSPAAAPIAATPFPALAQGRVRFVGDPVALVLAQTPETARDAAELVAVDYAPLPSVTDMEAALAPGAPALWKSARGNVAFTWSAGDPAATDAAFAAAHRTVAVELVNNRVAIAAMETRGALGAFDAATGRYTLWTASQMPHGLKEHLAPLLGVPPASVRVVVADVGGGFGAKNALYPEQLLVLWASRRVGRPVKWIGERGESFLADYAGRDNVTRAELALARDGRFLAMRFTTNANLGAYVAPKGALSPTSNVPALAGLYRTPAVHVSVTGVLTNTAPTDVYRGAGRPEAVHALERLVEAAARALGTDALTLRRNNMIAPAELPWRTPLGLTYDSGDFAAVLDAGLDRAHWAGFSARRAESERRGKLRGIGLTHYVERVAGGWSEESELELGPDGRLTAYLGSMSNGQGHETAYAQLLSEWLGVDPGAVEIVQGDTDRVRSGHGTGGSASIAIAGAALAEASRRIVERCRIAAGDLLETASVDIEFRDGVFAVAGTDRVASWQEVARATCGAAGAPVRESGFFQPPGPTFPNGCHVCEVAIDPDTGSVAIAGYAMVHDFGRVLNPMLLAGQLHGGVAQGLGQAAFEHVVHAPGSGQMLSGSLMDYCLPRADDLPDFVFETVSTPSSNPIGIKGCGEAGAAGAPPAFMNAVMNALAPLGIAELQMPATPERIWRAIATARQATS